jgi:AcrR family transcriptional regulator
MTSKQKNILNAALTLFAEDGFHATSTAKIAQEAGVSEGLIFRHYGNKDGLLDAILKEGEARLTALFSEIVMETSPAEIIRKTLDLGPNLLKNLDEATFWKLQYKIKWETEHYDSGKMLPLNRVLTFAFTELKYHAPQKEAEIILLLLDGIATRSFLQDDYDPTPIVHHLKNRYGLKN